MSPGEGHGRDAPGDERPWWASDDPTEAATGDGETGSARSGRLDHDSTEVCAACPFCALLRAVEETRPELVVHLVEAARQLSLAAKALVDTHLDHHPGDERVQHIPVDGD
ncbi:MAG: hypothetical protein ACRDUY_09390 [Nitriliruptorales bacterium]